MQCGAAVTNAACIPTTMIFVSDVNISPRGQPAELRRIVLPRIGVCLLLDTDCQCHRLQLQKEKHKGNVSRWFGAGGLSTCGTPSATCTHSSLSIIDQILRSRKLVACRWEAHPDSRVAAWGYYSLHLVELSESCLLSRACSIYMQSKKPVHI